jgi:arsenite methyltransferase
MAELTTPAETIENSCCAPEAQAACCEPSAKAACCDPSHGEGCGCAADTTTTQAGDIREQVRERYAAAAVQVTTTDPGPGCCAPSETFDGGSEVFGAALYALGDHEQLPDAAKLAGALTRQQFEQALMAAGLSDIEINETHRVHPQAVSAIVRAHKPSERSL